MTTALICILLSVSIGVAGQLLLKQGVMRLGVLSPTPGAVPLLVWRVATSPLVVLGLSCYAVGSLFWLVALSRVELSFAYPFASLSYVVIFVVSWLMFGETINAWKLAGMATICLGVLFIARA